uniref:Putative secreted protein n=1 Tax=Ixodes ricinus TaxID=34613 RepID=A0A6B0U5R2_IXORI
MFLHVLQLFLAGVLYLVCVHEAASKVFLLHTSLRRRHRSPPLRRRGAPAGSTASFTKHLRRCAFLCVWFLRRVRFGLQ